MPDTSPTPESSVLEALGLALERRHRRGWSGAPRAAEALAALVEVPPVSHVEAVARGFSLTAAETRVLEVAALAEESTSAHLLLGLLSGDDGPGRPTVALALELAGVGASAAAAHRVLPSSGTLRRSGLVTLLGDDVLLSRRVALPERVASHVAGGDVVPHLVAQVLVDPVELPVAESATVASALERGHQLVWVQTPPNGAGTALATAACRTAGVGHLVADLSRLETDSPALAPAPTEPTVQALLLECGLRGVVLVLVGAERADVEALALAPVPVIAVSSEPWDPRWSPQLPLVVRAPRLSVEDRRALWAPVFEGASEDRTLTSMPLSPEQIQAVSRHARELAHLHGEDLVTTARLRTSVRQLGRGKAQRANADSAATLDDLVLPAHARAEIDRLLDWARHRDDIAAMGRLHGKGGKGSGIAALFSGPPGTGKTMAAHVVADSLGMDLYQVEVATVVDKYIGETEKNLEKVFVEAESMHAVLFFDEADALFGSRSAVKDAKDRYANQEISYLLQRMEHFDGITLLATNLRGNIDPAFARRLHFMVAFPDPDEATRRLLWEQHLGELDGTDPADPVDLDRLAAAVELAGGEIRNMVLAAAYAAVADADGSGLVGMSHLVAAARREHVKLGRKPPTGF